MNAFRVEFDDEPEYEENQDSDGEQSQGVGYLCVVAQFLGGDSWDIVELGGCGDSLREWTYTNDLREVLGLSEPIWDRDEFTDAVKGTAVVGGMWVYARSHIEYTCSVGPDGEEWDSYWEIDARAIVYPEGEPTKSVMEACEKVVRAGGFCERCHVWLIGATEMARQKRMCDRCAEGDERLRVMLGR